MTNKRRNGGIWLALGTMALFTVRADVRPIAGVVQPGTTIPSGSIPAACKALAVPTALLDCYHDHRPASALLLGSRAQLGGRVLRQYSLRKPTVRGTRIGVEFVIDLLAAGWSHAQVLASYPHLTEEDIRACLAYASELLRER